MKRKIIGLAVLPLVLATVISLTAWQGKGNKEQGGEKGNKEQRGNAGGGQSDDNGKGPAKKQGGGADKKANDNYGPTRQKSESSDNYKSEKGKGNVNGNKNDQKSDDDNSGHNNKKNDQGFGKNDVDKNTGAGNKGNGKMGGKKWKENINWAQNGAINWNLNGTNVNDWDRPGKNKKVSVCHKTGDDGYPVNISVSENAVKAHLNHGDQVGNCNVDYQSWPRNYIQSRETVYNQYQTTWETMSYSEALVQLALNKILGLKSNLSQVRNTLSPEEIRRREALILDLQNNTNSLQNQTSATRQQLGLVSININL